MDLTWSHALVGTKDLLEVRLDTARQDRLGTLLVHGHQDVAALSDIGRSSCDLVELCMDLLQIFFINLSIFLLLFNECCFLLFPLGYHLTGFGEDTAEGLQLGWVSKYHSVRWFLVLADDSHAVIKLLEEQLELLSIFSSDSCQNAKCKAVVYSAEERHVGGFAHSDKQVLEGLQGGFP